MTIITTQARVTYAGDNVSTLFPVPFEFFLNSDLTVVKNAVGGGVAILVLGVDYTLANAGVPGGGTLTKTTALLTGETLAIFLDPPIEQESHYLSNSPFPASTLENDIDRQTQISQRLADQISRALRAPDGDPASGTLGFLLPSASLRANTFLTFDANGNPAVAVTLPSGTLSLASITALTGAQTPSEAAAGVTPTAKQYATLNPLRYGGIGDGVTNDAAAVQTAFTVAGKAGGAVIFPPGYTFLCNSDITVPVAASLGGPVASAQGPGWATISVIFGSGSTFGFVFLGTGATTGGTTSSAYNYAGKFSDLGIVLTGTARSAFYANSVNQPRVIDCWIRGSGTNGAAGYFLNCLLPVFHPLVTGCGSASQGSVEFDTCTTPNTDGMRISGGVTTVGGLLFDRCTNFIGRGMSIESCGTPIKISSKAEAVLANNGYDLSGLELENPGATTFIDIGSGLSGGALALNGRITAWRGSPSGTTTVAFGVRVQNCSGLELSSEQVTQGAAPTSFLEIVGTNVSGVVVRANRLLQSNAYAWVRYNGTQVKAAGCQYDWQLGLVNAGAPVCTNRGLYAMQVVSLTGTTPTVAISATAGGFYGAFQMANGGATTVATLSGGEDGMEITIYAADSNTTLTQGVGAGQFITQSGSNLNMSAGKSYKFIHNGTAWSQL